MLEKWPYFDQNHGKNVHFSTFLNFLFLQPGKAFFLFQNIVKIIFLTNIAQKKMLGKWPYLDQNHGLTPSQKCQLFDFWNFLFVLIAQKGAFSIQHIEKVIFLTYSAKKKKVGKMTIFGPKPWVNPFGKTSIFRHSELLVFIAKKGVFSFQNIAKVIFVTNIA